MSCGENSRIFTPSQFMQIVGFFTNFEIIDLDKKMAKNKCVTLQSILTKLSLNPKINVKLRNVNIAD